MTVLVVHTEDLGGEQSSDETTWQRSASQDSLTSHTVSPTADAVMVTTRTAEGTVRQPMGPHGAAILEGTALAHPAMKDQPYGSTGGLLINPQEPAEAPLSLTRHESPAENNVASTLVV